MKRFRNYLLVIFFIGCTSSTVTDQRFHESLTLSPPTVNVSLADSNHFSFAVVGDLHVSNQDTSRLNRILSAASAEGDSFIVLLGDLADQGALQDLSAIKDTLVAGGWSGKYLPVLGNHDVFNDGWTNYKNVNGASHYQVTIGNSRFLALDTADGNVGREQTQWLEGELKKPGPMNTFLISHYLPVIPGERTYLKLANEKEAIHLMKLATNHGVRGWMGAHYHSYIVERIEGVDYLVAGGGGGRRMQPVMDYFFVQVQVSGGDIRYTLHKVD
jgi:hypothetical protein